MSVNEELLKSGLVDIVNNAMVGLKAEIKIRRDCA